MTNDAEKALRIGKIIRAWVETWNQDPKPFVWHKSADEILQRLAGYCAAISQ